MEQLGTKELESEKLLLRRFTIEDAPAMYANWANDQEVTRFLIWPTHQSVKDNEDTLRQSDWNNLGLCDMAVYAILADDYAAEGQAHG